MWTLDLKCKTKCTSLILSNCILLSLRPHPFRCSCTSFRVLGAPDTSCVQGSLQLCLQSGAKVLKNNIIIGIYYLYNVNCWFQQSRLFICIEVATTTTRHGYWSNHWSTNVCSRFWCLLNGSMTPLRSRYGPVTVIRQMLVIFNWI